MPRDIRVHQESTENTNTKPKKKETIFPQSVVSSEGGDEMLTLERKITGPMTEVSSF
jgi:hypothetical protein